MPERIQLRRTAGWRKPEGAIVVARPSRWGNPYKVGQPVVRRSFLGEVTGEATAAEVVDAYRHLITRAHMSDDFLTALRGHDLACWCPLDQPCHADVLLELANA